VVAFSCFLVGVGDIAEMMVANSQLLASLAGSILELSETYKCGSIVRGAKTTPSSSHFSTEK